MLITTEWIAKFLVILSFVVGVSVGRVPKLKFHNLIFIQVLSSPRHRVTQAMKRSQSGCTIIR